MAYGLWISGFYQCCIRLLLWHLCFRILVRFQLYVSLMSGDTVLQFGYIVLTTSAGIMDHAEARRKNVGGKVLGFFY